MDEEIYRAMAIDPRLLRESDAYVSYREAQIRKLEFEREYLAKYNSTGGIAFTFDDEQRARDISQRLSDESTRIVREGLDFTVECLIRITNVKDIVQLSHDVRRSVIHGVHMKYERQQNHLDIYFEKKQDFVLVKMFTE